MKELDYHFLPLISEISDGCSFAWTLPVTPGNVETPRRNRMPFSQRDQYSLAELSIYATGFSAKGDTLSHCQFSDCGDLIER